MAVGLVVIKKGYRHGVQTEEWSNKYHLTGSDPANAAAWRTLFDAWCVEEKKLYSPSTQIVRAYGYTSDADDANAVWSVDMTVAPNTPVNGTFTTSGLNAMPSDTALWIRWKLDRTNSKGRNVYLRKYFHDVYATPSAQSSLSDTPSASQLGVYGTFATLLDTGAGIGGTHLRDTGGASIINHGVSSWFTTRTLKRRGKRP